MPTGGAPVISLPTGSVSMAAAAAAACTCTSGCRAGCCTGCAGRCSINRPQPPRPPQAWTGAPMNAPKPGMIVTYEKNVGDAVSEGETVLIHEAMKMENALMAPCSDTIQAINYRSGDSVAKGSVL